MISIIFLDNMTENQVLHVVSRKLHGNIFTSTAMLGKIRRFPFEFWRWRTHSHKFPLPLTRPTLAHKSLGTSNASSNKTSFQQFLFQFAQLFKIFRNSQVILVFFHCWRRKSFIGRKYNALEFRTTTKFDWQQVFTIFTFIQRYSTCKTISIN